MMYVPSLFLKSIGSLNSFLSLSLPPSFIHRNQLIIKKCTWPGKGHNEHSVIKELSLHYRVATYPFSPFQKRMDLRTKYPHLKTHSQMFRSIGCMIEITHRINQQPFLYC